MEQNNNSNQKNQHENWCEKYRAGCFADIKGQNIAIDRLKIFIKRFPIKKAILFYGPSGTGKTSLAYAIARETGAEILELNASNLRNRDMLQSILKPAIEQKSLYSKNKIILVDEIDGISTYADKGGLPELLVLIEKTNFPIIITANNIWQQKFNLLRQKCELIKLEEVDYNLIIKILEYIAEKEGISKEIDTLKSIAANARGDVRAAINDLQTMTSKLEEKKFHEFGIREKEEDIFNVMKIIFKNQPNSELLQLFEKLDMPLDDVFLWIEENIPHEYQGKDLAKAFDALSKADVFKGRIHRQQHWRFLAYENALLSAGISAAKSSINFNFTLYKKPDRILKIWLSNQKNSKKKTIVAKYAKATHCSKKRAVKEFSIFKLIISKNKNNENAEKIQKELKLDEGEIEFLKEIKK